MSRKIFYYVLFLVLTTLWPVSAQASPFYQGSTVLVRVCYDNPSCTSPSPSNTHGTNLDIYTEQVLANEWHTSALLEALKAGAISIRTFAYRSPGCGAYKAWYTESPGPPPITSRLLDNRGQAYRIGGYNGSQNTITTNHVLARSQTANTFLYRADSTFSCAKHNANTGNPTRACVAGECTSDAADQETMPETADPVGTNNYVAARFQVGMCQNGSAAWAIGSAGWDYRQILTHYYTKIKLTNTSDTYYRWVWLNVGNNIVFTGYPGSYYEEYYGPINPTPSCLYVGGNKPVSLRIQNASRQTWDSSVKLSYNWYTSSGSFINQGPEFNVPSLSPGQNTTLNVTLSPPNGGTAGNFYTLK